FDQAGSPVGVASEAFEPERVRLIREATARASSLYPLTMGEREMPGLGFNFRDRAGAAPAAAVNVATDTQFYVYGIKPDDGFFLSRIDTGGVAAWYKDALGEDDLSNALNAWSGYGGGSATTLGFLVPVINEALSATTDCGCYLVRPDV